MKKNTTLIIIFALGFLLIGMSAQAQTCEPIAGGAPGEVYCKPATTPPPPGCVADGSGGMICEASPTNSTCPTCSSTRPTGTLNTSSVSVTPGQPVTLSWQTTNATGCQIEGVGPVEPSGSRKVVVSQSTTFRLACIEPGRPGATLEAIAQVNVSMIPNTQTQNGVANRVLTDPCTDAGGGKLGYCPLEPLPGFTGDLSQLNFAQLLGLLFNILFTAGALFAVVMLVIGGIGYMVTAGGVGEIGEARKRMWAAILGLIILAGAWLILYTINPHLLNFDLSIKGTSISPQPFNTPSGTNMQSSAQINQVIQNCPLPKKIDRVNGSFQCI
jgi:hypothetical protein